MIDMEMLPDSKNDCSGLMEMLYLISQPGMKEKLLDGMNIPLEECIPENEVCWS